MNTSGGAHPRSTEATALPYSENRQSDGRQLFGHQRGERHVIMSAEKASELHQTSGEDKGSGKGGCHPSVMGLACSGDAGPFQKISDLRMGDFELIELNEAFALSILGSRES